MSPEMRRCGFARSRGSPRERDTRRLERRRDLVGGLTHDVRAIVRAERGGEGAHRLVLSATSEDHVQRSSGKRASARIAAATFVAFESLTNRTPWTVATSSIRCSTPRKLRSAARCRRRRFRRRAARAWRQRRSRGCAAPVAGSAGSGRRPRTRPSGSSGDRPESRDDRDVVLGLEPEQPSLVSAYDARSP